MSQENIKKTRKPVDYQNGKIYQVVNSINDKIYIGSCSTDLRIRFNRHKNEAKQNYLNSNRRFYDEFKDNLEKFKIILIENYPCETKNELEKREYEVIQEKMRELGRERLYNASLTQSGEGHSHFGKRGAKCSEERKKNISKSLIGKMRGRTGKEKAKGSIIEADDRKRYCFQWRVYENDILQRNTKIFNYNVYGSKENALKACKEFQKTIYPHLLENDDEN
jgi:predicted GIY-YIG superfamily endonuclease